MNLKEQLYVCTLAETGSLTQAAKQLFISQPALSLYISNLENTMGIRLFDRVGKQFTLTMAGELYVKNARQMLALKEIFDSELMELKSGQNERLRVGIQNIRSQFLTPLVLPRLTERYPRTKITWQEDNYWFLEQQLLENVLDIAFCNCKTKQKELEYIPLISDEIVFTTSKSHPLASKAEYRPDCSFPWIDLSLFEHERFILPNKTQSLRIYGDQIMKTCGIAPKNILVIKRISVILSLISQGYGVGFAQTGYIAQSPYINNLRLFSVSVPPVTAPFYVIYKKGHQLTLAENTLIDLISSNLIEQSNHLFCGPQIPSLPD